jgi:hypothetical protein
MATAQAFCSICQSKVSADTILSDDALRKALDLGEESVSCTSSWTKMTVLLITSGV